jgi:hypothetical protein
MASEGVSLSLIKNALNHKDMKTTMTVYARTTKDAECQGREQAHNAMLKAAGMLEETNNVVELSAPIEKTVKKTAAVRPSKSTSI